MPSLGEIALRGLRLALFLAGSALVWMAGIGLAKLRGPRPENVIWYDGGQLGIGAFGVPFGLAAIAARLMHVPGWDNDIAWWLAAICFATTILMALVVFRYRVVVLPDAIIETRVLRPGSRRVEWRDVVSWQAGRRPGSVILKLRTVGRFEFATVFKAGSETLLAAIDARNIPEA
jgi:hypothetical protein